MTVFIRLQQASNPLVFNNISNAYTKGGLYCLRLEDGSTLKLPLISIFSIREEEGK